ncbi:MBL fold metallo-hydrolase [Chloroflexota bacterium]
MQQISANVYVEVEPPGDYDSMPGCNCSFVVTSEGVVMIDTPSRPKDAMRWRNEMASKGDVRYIINTEYHPDHISGNYFFPGTVVSHEGVREILAGPVDKWLAYPEGIKLALEASMGIPDYILYRFKELDPESFHLAENYQLRPPTISFSDRLTLYLGDHTFELIHLPGHTPYEVAVYVPQERVIFTGDNVTGGVQPSLAHSLPQEWLESLKKIEAMDVDVIVTGHGEVGDKRLVPEVTGFIQKCMDEVRKAIGQGMSKEEAANKISFEEDRTAIHPGSWQQRLNVMRLYEMLSE